MKYNIGINQKWIDVLLQFFQEVVLKDSGRKEIFLVGGSLNGMFSCYLEGEKVSVLDRISGQQFSWIFIDLEGIRLEGEGYRGLGKIMWVKLFLDVVGLLCC